MKILVINAGSSSLKLQLFNNKGEFVYKGLIDGIYTEKSTLTEQYNNHEFSLTIPSTNHEQALKIFIERLRKHEIIQNLQEITAVGHRVVHGGEVYKQATLITKKVVKKIKDLCTLAPLHNPANLQAIEACLKLLPKIPQVAVFDTAFHESIPEKAFLYALPYSFYQESGIRRYGFHGTSHHYVSKQTTKLLGKKKSKIIVCHLGNGSSITAVKNGKSIDTSMGFTPLEGLPMGTRSGDIDPAIIFHLERMLKLTNTEIEHLLLKKSGLLGVSGISSDMRSIWAETQKENPKAVRALELLAYRIAKYIGAYTAALNGLDGLVFTGGMGEKAFYLRQKVCDYFEYLGLKLEYQKNKQNLVQIHAAKSKVKVFVIPTNEEKQIAEETKSLLGMRAKKMLALKK